MSALEIRPGASVGSANWLPSSRYGPHKRSDASADDHTIERVAVPAVAMPHAVSKGAARLSTVFRR
jgi:hypothetical protein